MLLLKTFLPFLKIVVTVYYLRLLTNTGEKRTERSSSPSKERYNETWPLVTRHSVTGRLERKNSERLQ